MKNQIYNTKRRQAEIKKLEELKQTLMNIVENQRSLQNEEIQQKEKPKVFVKMPNLDTRGFANGFIFTLIVGAFLGAIFTTFYILSFL